MAEGEQSGPSPATMALIAVLALPVLLVLLFLIVGRVQSAQDSPLPQLETKGLKWAQVRAEDAGFGEIQTHDALGRDRGQRDSKNWMVCFQVPPAGNYERKTTVELGVVRLDEVCPSSDQGRIVQAGATMPDFVNRTAYMATRSLGEDASVRFVNVTTQREVTNNLGDYRICQQEPIAGAPWDGVPVKAAVVAYTDSCDNPKGVDPEDSPMDVVNRVLNDLAT